MTTIEERTEAQLYELCQRYEAAFAVEVTRRINGNYSHNVRQALFGMQYLDALSDGTGCNTHSALVCGTTSSDYRDDVSFMLTVEQLRKGLLEQVLRADQIAGLCSGNDRQAIEYIHDIVDHGELDLFSLYMGRFIEVGFTDSQRAVFKCCHEVHMDSICGTAFEIYVGRLFERTMQDCEVVYRQTYFREETLQTDVGEQVAVEKLGEIDLILFCNIDDIRKQLDHLGSIKVGSEYEFRVMRNGHF